MGFRINMGPVSVGNKSAGINVGPVSASKAYRSNSSGSASSGDNSGLIMVVLHAVLWWLMFPVLFNDQLKLEGKDPSKNFTSAFLFLLGIPVVVATWFLAYLGGPSFWNGLFIVFIFNLLAAIPMFVIYAIAFEIVKRRLPPLPKPEEQPEATTPK